MDKQTLRVLMKEKRNAISPKEHALWDDAIVNQLLHLDVYDSCKVILSYAALGSEVNLAKLLIQAVLDGKRVYYPKVSGEDMEFFLITQIEQLKEGHFQVLEPSGREPHLDLACDWSKTLILCPGLAFGENGHRIGYGKGYYDRYIGRCKAHNIDFTTIGIAYDCQITNDFLGDSYDEPLDMIISENRKVLI